MTFADFVGGGDSGILGAINIFVVPLILSLSFLVFVGGVVYYFFIHGGEEGKRAEGRNFVFWGVLGLALLVSVWSVVYILLRTLRLSVFSI